MVIKEGFKRKGGEKKIRTCSNRHEKKIRKLARSHETSMGLTDAWLMRGN